MELVDKTSELFRKINRLPIDVIKIINVYIPKITTIFLNKQTYLEYHKLLRQYINKNNIENYIRLMIRQDNDFVFNQLLDENYIRWHCMKQYYYNECIYATYLNFLVSYSIDNHSIKCKKLILNLFEELGLNKNQHKKKTNRYIRWRT
jgi:hypothetical protein